MQIGFLYSIRDIANNILEIPTGVFADTFGRRKAMVLAFWLTLSRFIIFFAFEGFPIYALAMVVFAFGEAFRSGTHKALILEYLNLNDMLDQKVAYYGRTRGASQLGSAFNALIAAGLLFYTGDYRAMFLATTIPYILDLFNLATYPKELDGELANLEGGAMSGTDQSNPKGFRGDLQIAQSHASNPQQRQFLRFIQNQQGLSPTDLGELRPGHPIPGSPG